MANDARFESTLTDRYQTTVPESVRRALGLKKRDKLRFEIRNTNEVIVTRARTSDDEDNGDEALRPFLELLANDISRHPARIHGISSNQVKALRDLIGSESVDLTAALSPEDE